MALALVFGNGGTDGHRIGRFGLRGWLGGLWPDGGAVVCSVIGPPAPAPGTNAQAYSLRAPLEANLGRAGVGIDRRPVLVDPPAGQALTAAVALAPAATPPLLGPADLAAAFTAGYTANGGPPALLDHLLNVIIPCESHWNVDPVGEHAGLLQFSDDTWAKCARPGADYRDPFEQGWAAACWIPQIDPASSAGWRACWGY